MELQKQPVATAGRTLSERSMRAAAEAAQAAEAAETATLEAEIADVKHEMGKELSGAHRSLKARHQQKMASGNSRRGQSSQSLSSMSLGRCPNIIPRYWASARVGANATVADSLGSMGNLLDVEPLNQDIGGATELPFISLPADSPFAGMPYCIPSPDDEHAADYAARNITGSGRIASISLDEYDPNSPVAEEMLTGAEWATDMMHALPQ
jgi:hypothetical protein